MPHLLALAVLSLLLAACDGREDKSERGERSSPEPTPISLPRLY